MIKDIMLTTSKKEELITITPKIQDVVKKSGIKDGIVVCFIHHTTAGITINENADFNVVRDILHALERAVPDEGFLHQEGNSTSHVKASMMGHSETIIIDKGELCLGTWQNVYFCEFDGPRHRKISIKVMGK